MCDINSPCAIALGLIFGLGLPLLCFCTCVALAYTAISQPRRIADAAAARAERVANHAIYTVQASPNAPQLLEALAQQALKQGGAMGGVGAFGRQPGPMRSGQRGPFP